MPASKAINTADSSSSSIYWPWPLQKLSVCITMDFDEHTMQWRGGEKGWVSKVGALTAVAWMQKKSATSVHPLVGSERQFSICTFVKVTHVPLLANWSGKAANHESFGEI